MDTEFENRPARPSILKRVLAGLVLVLAVVVAFKLLIGMVMAVFWLIVTVAVVVAILWALKTIFW
jgi:hypothetical protein